MNSWLNWIGIARRAGALAPGNNQVEMALKAGRVALLVLSTDAGPSVYRKYHLWAQDLNVPILRAGTKEELGRSIGMGPHAILAILDTNIAQRLMASGELSGGIQRGRKGQSSGLRVGEGVKTRQPTTNRSTTSAQSRKHQKSHEHGGAGSGTDGAQHYGGKTAAGAKDRTRAQTSRTASPRGPKTFDRGAGRGPRGGTTTVSEPGTVGTRDTTNAVAGSHAKNAGRPTRKTAVSQQSSQRSTGVPREPGSNRDSRRGPTGSPTLSKSTGHSGSTPRVSKPSTSGGAKSPRPASVSESPSRGSAAIPRKPGTQQRGSTPVPRKPRTQRGGPAGVRKPTPKR